VPVRSSGHCGSPKSHEIVTCAVPDIEDWVSTLEQLVSPPLVGSDGRPRGHAFLPIDRSSRVCAGVDVGIGPAHTRSLSSVLAHHSDLGPEAPTRVLGDSF
jgi:hypothetical protein